jgi:hypothetical protein
MPPKRATPVAPEPSESIDARYERLQLEVRLQRRLAEIEEMEQELRTGVSPATRTLNAGALPAPSESASRAARRAMPPPVFRGTSLRELRDFQQGCEVFFDGIDEPDTRRRIMTAASYLRDLPLQEWSRRTSTPATWEAFTRFLRNTIADPANRMGTASLRLKRAEQREGQSARQFASYIEELEEDIPEEMSREEQRAWTLLNGLRASIRSGVLRENKTITSRAQVLSAAQRQEELLGEVDGKSTGNTSSGTGVTSEIGGKPRKRMRSESSATLLCYKCGKEGHFKKDCPEKGSK